MDVIRKKSLPPRNSLMDKSLTPKKHFEKINNLNNFVGNQYLSSNDDDFGLKKK
jgi:hypothetical protein